MSSGVSRRAMLRGTAITVAAGTTAAATTTTAKAASAVPTAPAASKLPRGLDLETATVADLRPLLDSGKLTSETLTAAYLERIEALSNQRPAVNAVRMVNPLALEEARAADRKLKSYLLGRKPYSPLLGIPVLLKDNIDATPMPTTAGSVAPAEPSGRRAGHRYTSLTAGEHARRRLRPMRAGRPGRSDLKGGSVP